MSKKMLNLKYHVLQKGAEYQTSGYKEPDRPDHAALDIISKAGSSASDKIVTPFPGKVLEIRNSIPGNSTKNASGNYAIVNFGNGFQGRFYHMKAQSVVVTVGQQLAARAVIGTMGYTGHTIPEGPAGTHLHFEMRKDGVKIDPTPYLRGEKSIGSTPVTPPPTQPTKSVAEVAREIIAGTNGWGNGKDRINNLTAKGYNPKTVQAEVNRILREGTTTPPVAATIKVGSTVMLRPGCTDYTGRTLRAFLFARKYKVSELNKDRVVITYGGIVIAAVNIKDLVLQS